MSNFINFIYLLVMKWNQDAMSGAIGSSLGGVCCTSGWSLGEEYYNGRMIPMLYTII